MAVFYSVHIFISRSESAMIMVMAKSKSKKRLIIVVLSVLALAALAVGAYFYFNHNKSAPAAKQTAAGGAVDSGGVDDVKPAQDVKQSITQETDAKKQAKLYADLSASEAQNENYKAAAEAAAKAASLDPKADYYGAAANYYREAGDTEKAITNFREALKLTPKEGGPDDNTPYNYYLGQLTELGGSL